MALAEAPLLAALFPQASVVVHVPFPDLPSAWAPSRPASATPTGFSSWAGAGAAI